jgi:hypothetical protein
MSNEHSGNPIWDGVKVGDQLEPYEYVVSQEMLDEYRHIVDNPKAAYPTVAGRHSLRAWTNRYGPATLMNVGAESEYLNPVIPGKRIRVEATIVDKYIRRGKPYILVDSIAVDEDGHLIEKSRLIGMAAKQAKPLFSEVAGKWEKN